MTSRVIQGHLWCWYSRLHRLIQSRKCGPTLCVYCLRDVSSLAHYLLYCVRDNLVLEHWLIQTGLLAFYSTVLMLTVSLLYCVITTTKRRLFWH